MHLRYYFSLLLCVAATLPASACSCAYYESIFCANLNTVHTVVLAEVLDLSEQDPTMRVAVLDEIQNITSADTIRVLGQDGVNCLQQLNVFHPGDTVVLGMYEGEFFPYGQAYALPGLCGKMYLNYVDGQVLGEITDVQTSQPYADFRAELADCLEFTASVNAAELDRSLTVFPNPARDVVSVQTDHSQITRIELFDIAGHPLRSETFAAAHAQRLDLPGLPAGVYAMRIYDRHGTSVWRRIVLR